MKSHNGVIIARGCLQYIADHVEGEQVAIVSHDSIAQHHIETLKTQLKDKTVITVNLPEGEVHKNWGSVQQILDALIQHHFNRQCTLVGLGGGVVTDVTGFAASIYLRGVNVIQVPTSLLAQVDASVGGKTGINHPQGKNLIGTFYTPKACLIDIQTLATLPQHHYIAGLAEVVKAALICDAPFFAWLEANASDILARDEVAMETMVTRAVAIKQSIVDKDFKEAGLRRLLNLGHTFGHALEAASQYTLLHGHAVSMGMVMAAEASYQQNRLSLAEVERIKALLQAFGLPVAVDPAHSNWKSHLKYDKKANDQGLQFILLNHIGEAVSAPLHDT